MLYNDVADDVSPRMTDRKSTVKREGGKGGGNTPTLYPSFGGSSNFSRGTPSTASTTPLEMRPYKGPGGWPDSRQRLAQA